MEHVSFFSQGRGVGEEVKHMDTGVILVQFGRFWRRGSGSSGFFFLNLCEVSSFKQVVPFSHSLCCSEIHFHDAVEVFRNPEVQSRPRSFEPFLWAYGWITSISLHIRMSCWDVHSICLNVEKTLKKQEEIPTQLTAICGSAQPQKHKFQSQVSTKMQKYNTKFDRNTWSFKYGKEDIK